jgi:hypothetical protein
MPYVMCCIVNDVDMGKPDHADDEKAKSHRQHTLKNDAHPRADEQRETSSIRVLQDGLHK